MEMDGVSLVVFLLFNVGGAANIFVRTGANYTFRSDIIATFQSIQWTHNSNLVVELDAPSTKPDWYRFSERGELDIKTGDLTLRVVKKEDSGLFKGQFQVDGVLRYAEYSITVVDPFSECTVTCVKYNKTYATLACAVKSPALATFVWSGPNGFSHTGKSVQINTESDSIFYCTAQNEVSKSTTEFKLKDCSQDPGPDPPTNTGAIVGGIIGAVAAVALGVVGWLKKESISALFSAGGHDAANKGQASNSQKNDESVGLQAPNNGGE